MNGCLGSLTHLASADAPLSRPALWAGMVCLAWGAGIAAWCGAQLRRRLAARRKFAARAEEAGFDRSEVRVLWLLGRHAPRRRREAILESVETFDLCVRGAERGAGDDPVMWPEYLSGSAAAALRRKYTRPRAERTRHQIGGTRDMEANQLVNVRLGDGPWLKSFTLGVSGERLTLSVPEEARAALSGRSGGRAGGREEAGEPVSLSFWRAHDARYECVSRGTMEGGSLSVAHAALNRVQEREHVRVRCRQEVRLRLAQPEPEPLAAEEEEAAAGRRPDAAGPPFAAMLHDISNGGASFVSDREVPAGARVLLRLKLARKPGSLTLAGRVLRQRLLEGTSNPSWASSMQFEGLSPRAEQQLSRFIADMQRRLIARMLSRAGAEEEGAPAELARGWSEPAPRGRAAAAARDRAEGGSGEEAAGREEQGGRTGWAPELRVQGAAKARFAPSGAVSRPAARRATGS